MLEGIGRLDPAVRFAAGDRRDEILEIIDAVFHRADPLHLVDEIGEVMAEGPGDGASLVVERLHGAADALRHGIDIEGEVATPRFHPGSSENGARRMQHHIDVAEVAGEHVADRLGGREEHLRGRDRRLAAG
jgi:hypothetical protein